MPEPISFEEFLSVAAQPAQGSTLRHLYDHLVSIGVDIAAVLEGREMPRPERPAYLQEWARDGVLRMRAYYYSFEPTGVEAVDAVLSAVAIAGKRYHLTEDWGETPYGENPDPSAVEGIQQAAVYAAQLVRRAAPDLSTLRELAREMLARAEGFGGKLSAPLPTDIREGDVASAATGYGQLTEFGNRLTAAIDAIVSRDVEKGGA